MADDGDVHPAERSSERLQRAVTGGEQAVILEGVRCWSSVGLALVFGCSVAPVDDLVLRPVFRDGAIDRPDTGPPRFDAGRDAGLRRDAGRDGGPNPIDAGVPCAVGLEGCACDFDFCLDGSECVHWPTTAGPEVKSCVRRCTGDDVCRQTSRVGGLCSAFFLNPGVAGICVNSRARETASCSGFGVGCAERLTCLTNFGEGGSGICARTCLNQPPAQPEPCPPDEPYCSPRGSGVSIDGPNGSVPLGVCTIGPLGPGNACNTRDLRSSCDTAPEVGSLVCVSLPDLGVGGYCVETCDVTTMLCRSPGLCRAVLTNPPTGICSAECSRFSDDCVGLGFSGVGRTCSDDLQFSSGGLSFNFCLDVLRPPLNETLLHLVNGMLAPIGLIDSCAMGADRYRCPDGTFCATQGNFGACVRGCDPAVTSTNGACLMGQLCSPLPEGGLCVFPQ